MEPIEILCEGTHLNFVKRGRWEFVTRTKAHGGVVIVAITDEEKVVLVEQFRPPAGGNVIELPAGLAGDEGDNESLLTAAKRELEEETGYTASRWTRLFSGLSSAGLSDETLTLFLAEDLSRTASGGGVAGETITVHEVAIGCLTDWLDDKRREGKLLDLKLLGGLWAVQKIRKPPE